MALGKSSAVARIHLVRTQVGSVMEFTDMWCLHVYNTRAEGAVTDPLAGLSPHTGYNVAEWPPMMSAYTLSVCLLVDVVVCTGVAALVSNITREVRSSLYEVLVHLLC